MRSSRGLVGKVTYPGELLAGIVLTIDPKLDFWYSKEATRRGTEQQLTWSKHFRMGKVTWTDPVQHDQSYDVSAPGYDEAEDQIQPCIAEIQQKSRARVNEDGRVSFDLRPGLSQVPDSVRTQLADITTQPDHDQPLQSVERSPTPLNIVMQVVGSQGDVQPFVALALALQNCGHRVRIATHPQFRQFVKSYGIEFFSIGGDPAELMAFMVENPGLIPKFVSVQKGEVHKRRRTMRDIMHACWRSCYESTDDSTDIGVQRGDPKPFVADAIIANPPSFAHIHCAEKLGIPLHMVFTMPWSPTRELAHPLAIIDAPQADAKMANFLSFFLIDALIWQGLGDIVNRFRTKVLDLEPVDPTQAPGFITRLQIPQTYCWSPSLVPKPRDWSMLSTVSGYFFLETPDTYSPHPGLLEFLNSGSSPVYIGFGSIVVDDPATLTKIVLEAIKIAGVRAIISRGWGQLGHGTTVPGAITSFNSPDPDIFFLSSCPHHWLFPRVSCVVHHGGAGTTAAGLAAGKPTVVVPFFGDQPFWGNMIHRCGVGPQPILAKHLTAENLAAAILFATTDGTVQRCAARVQEQIRSENGLENAVDHFHRCLPDSVSPNLDAGPLSVWQYTKRKGKRNIDVELSAAEATVLRKEKLIDWSELKLHRHMEYDVAHYGPHEPFSGAAVAVGDLFYESFKGMGEILYEVVGGPYASSFKVWKKNRNGALKPSEQSSPNTIVYSTKRGSSSGVVCSGVAIPDSSKPPDSSKMYIPGRHAATGIFRIGKAAARAPGEFTLAMARGAHNVPKYWGDRTVRPQEKVTGMSNGLKQGVKELAFGVSDGISGLFVQPVLGFIEGGSLGFVKGVGKGVVGLPVKFVAAASGIVGYPLKGVDVSITHAVKRPDAGLKAVRHARMLQGEILYLDMSVETRQGVIDWWESLKLESD